MAIFLGAKGGDIVGSLNTNRLLTDVREKMGGRMAYLLAGEDVALFCRLRDRLGDELAFEEDFSRRFDQQVHGLAEAEYADQLAEACSCFMALAREHFSRRGSVISFQQLCTRFNDLFFQKALVLAEAGTDDPDLRPPKPCCLLAAGSAGRSEFSPGLDSRYFLVYPDSLLKDAWQFEEMRYRLIAIFDSCGVFGAGNRFSDDGGIWVGPESQWRSWVAQQVQGMERLADMMASLGDLRGVAGEEAMRDSLTDFAAETMAREQKKEVYIHAVRKLSSIPVALGMFGNFKTLRSGEHRGSFNFDEAAFNPLLVNVRAMALHYGIRETGTIDRIKELLGAGHLGVELADRLLKAYHVFAGYRIGKSLAAVDGKLKELYLNPDELGEEESYLHKSSLETVLNLEKIVYQVFSEQG